MRQYIDLINESAIEEEEVLDEAPRASAVWKREIPAKYRGLNLLGRGMTSLVFEKDAETVLIFTRDVIKAEYMRDCGIARYVDAFDSHMHPVPAMREIEVIVLEMPKLEKISGKNIALVRRACKEVGDVLAKARQKFGYRMSGKQAHELAVREACVHFSEDENHLLYEFWSFISNYDASQFAIDIGPRNFLQKVTGEIVVTDPVCAKDVIEILDNHKAQQYRDQGGYGRY
ncbi:MAG: hypothetical protein EOP83_09015 [Verrucomicrobiaceae bacterium]|nr:MAG: hypothetical protein EOP83_09015 [Verrucomicrobiaceae bacterium]